MPHIKANGIELFYDLTGPDNAPVIVFSNSLGTTLEMWDKQIPALSKNYRCLRYDTRGHGRSEVVDTPASIDDLAADLDGLLSVLGIERAHVVGLSLGGMTAQVFAAHYPQSVISLTLMATAAYMPSNWDERAAIVRAQGMDAIANAVVERWFTPQFRSAHEEDVAPVRERLRAIDPRGYAICCGAIRDMDLRARIASIRAPTLILAGMQDPATPVAIMQDIQAVIEGAELVVLPKAAHLVAIESANAVNRHLQNFLARHDLPTATPNDARFAAGLATRKAVLGEAHVARSLANASAFDMPWQEFITRTAWGDIWSDPTLPRKTRSLVTLAMMVALGREEEFKLHLRPALGNGVSLEELQALLMQTAIYAGVPAANGAFRWAIEVLGDELDRLN